METKTLPGRDVATLILYSDEGKVLLQHRSPTAKRHPNKWGIFGGGIESGEMPEEAMRREILEELEYRVTDPQLFYSGMFENSYGGGIYQKYAFIERYDPSQPLVQHEGQGMGWFLPSDIAALSIIEHDRPVFERLQQYMQEHGIVHV